MLYWLLDEVKHLSLAALAEFQQHATWKFQYLAAFEFTHSEGYEAYDNLFGPNLIQPIEKFLAENPCVRFSNERRKLTAAHRSLLVADAVARITSAARPGLPGDAAILGHSAGLWAIASDAGRAQGQCLVQFWALCGASEPEQLPWANPV